MTLADFIEFIRERSLGECKRCPFSVLTGDWDSEQIYDECKFERCPSNWKADEIEKAIKDWKRSHE